MKRLFTVILFFVCPIASAFSCPCVSTYISQTKDISPEAYIFEASLVCDNIADEDFVNLTKNNWFVLKVHRYWGKEPTSMVIGLSDFSECGIKRLKPNTKYLISATRLDLSRSELFMKLSQCSVTEMSEVPALELERNGDGVFLENSISDSLPCRTKFLKLKSENNNLLQELSKLKADLRTKKVEYYFQNSIHQASPLLLVLLLVFVAFKNKMLGLAKMWFHFLINKK
jgi:hypothetical protein